MLTALAPSGPVAPMVPAPPPSLSDTAQPVQRETFKDIYQDLPAQQEASSDSAPKQKDSGPSGTRTKKADEDRGDKSATAIIPSPQNSALLKAPLSLKIALFGQDNGELSSGDNSGGTTAEGKELAGPGSGSTALQSHIELPLLKVNAAPAITSVPNNERIAFAARLTQLNGETAQASTHAISQGEARSLQSGRTPGLAASGESVARETDQPGAAIKAVRAETIMPVHEIALTASVDARQMAPAPQTAEAIHPAARNVAVQDIQPALPEIPKPPSSTEIMLQLAGKDQSTASVRVVERSGTVNVSVHASDPELRNSLRANLGDLASQLSSQGFRTEVIRPAVGAANADNQHDSRQGGENPAGQHQQHLGQDGRQAQRGRHSNSESWLEQFEEQTSGTAGTDGGKA